MNFLRKGFQKNCKRRMRKECIMGLLVVAFLLAMPCAAQNNKPLNIVKIEVSSQKGLADAGLMMDGSVENDSRWLSEPEENSWIELTLSKEKQIGGVHIYSGYGDNSAIEDFQIQFQKDEVWEEIPSAIIYDNSKTAISIEFDDTKQVKTKKLRINITKSHQNIVRVKEVVIWPYTGTNIPNLSYQSKKEKETENIPSIYINQSGYNIGASKRFTAPTMADDTPFTISTFAGNSMVYQGDINNHIGDFSDFNPLETDIQYQIKAGDEVSFPFYIGNWWLEKVTYQNMINFMIDARHYTGNFEKECKGSFGWRDDHHFAWELHALVTQYLSNPEAYLRMPSQIVYKAPTDSSLWGKLSPYSQDVPDIIKLIHWGADVIISQELTHEHLKAQLAYFLYAWPWLKEWLPEENYQIVKEYTFKVWELNKTDHEYPYDESKGHNLLELKTQIGSTKGALPPGFSVMPNLLLYEVAAREGMNDKEKFFKAAYRQVEWMIKELDWTDPLVTKGQRMSEHLTMAGLAQMFTQYPKRAPEGLKEKVEQWCDIMLSRSDNMWDFRKLSEEQWVPTGSAVTMWNEPGNVLGFPACLLAAMQVVNSEEMKKQMDRLIYSHFDNAFGRNPTGRHCVYSGVEDVEGVDIGWYSFHTGIGQLQGVRFVIEATAKNRHYPYSPKLGNIGWSEGWVNFNTAFNLSMAYLSNRDTEISTVRKGKYYEIKLKVPLNFDYHQQEKVDVWITDNTGKQMKVMLKEDGTNSKYFVGRINRKMKPRKVSYAYGFFSHIAEFK